MFSRLNWCSEFPPTQRQRPLAPDKTSVYSFSWIRAGVLLFISHLWGQERFLFDKGTGRGLSSGVWLGTLLWHWNSPGELSTPFLPGAVRRTKALGYNLDFVYLCETLQVLLFAPDKSGKF